ncbi:hypothetical protein [Flavobacterium johnsoniae]|uniref:Uncharacterized protein n=1 Tax=Flavobacterium johnsoniae TaxID=986 RepID=A0A1J7CDY5_FLAJO|nr:hypothetical protein [Flavobacterium johnsoniae]OIV39780.1 hypothetical protein BKM63_23255 [Flavobacterium johnsoniae]
MFSFGKSNKAPIENNLVDERGNKGIIFILVLVIIGLVFTVLYACDNDKTFIPVFTTLFFIAGGIFAFTTLIGFLFGIPRTIVIDESEKVKSRYMGNDNLLQVSDWLTKIILGLVYIL